jgi:hypothetical protein
MSGFRKRERLLELNPETRPNSVSLSVRGLKLHMLIRMTPEAGVASSSFLVSLRCWGTPTGIAIAGAHVPVNYAVSEYF